METILDTDVPVTVTVDDCIAGEVSRVPRLSRAQFEDQYRFNRPVVVTNGAGRMPALARWSLTYLRDTVGSATVHVADYQSDAKDYDRVVRAPINFDVYLQDLIDGTNAGRRYLFNNTSCVFARNERRTDLHVGWARGVNPGLAALAKDFRLPPIVRADDFVIAALILGSQYNGTDLHYDNGGEAKVLVQLRGRKRIVLFPPSAASIVGMRSPFRSETPDGKRPNPSRTRIDALTPSQAAALRDAGVLRVDLEPGDALYWPAFWLHDVTNVDGPNLAIGIFVDEIHLSPLLMRHLLMKTYRDLDTILRAQGAGMDGAPAAPPLADLFHQYERFLLSDECRTLSNLWQWNEARPGGDRR